MKSLKSIVQESPDGWHTNEDDWALWGDKDAWGFFLDKDLKWLLVTKGTHTDTFCNYYIQLIDPEYAPEFMVAREVTGDVEKLNQAMLEYVHGNVDFISYLMDRNRTNKVALRKVLGDRPRNMDLSGVYPSEIIRQFNYCGRFWLDKKRISFWNHSDEVKGNIQSIAKTLNSLFFKKGVDFTTFEYENADEWDEAAGKPRFRQVMDDPDAIVKPKMSDDEKEHLDMIYKELLKKQHLDPEAKKKLKAMDGAVQAPVRSGNDIRAKFARNIGDSVEYKDLAKLL